MLKPNYTHPHLRILGPYRPVLQVEMFHQYYSRVDHPSERWPVVSFHHPHRVDPYGTASFPIPMPLQGGTE